MKISVLLIMLIPLTNSFAQSVGIGDHEFTPDNSAALEVLSTNKGLLIPRITEEQRTAISSPAKGLLIYQTNNITGFYYYDGMQWKPLMSAVDDLDTDSTNELQTLSIQNDTIYLSDGGYAALPKIAPGTDEQHLSFSSPNLSIDRGNTVDLSAVNTDNQDLSLIGNLLSLTNDATPINLSAYRDNTDTQRLSFTNPNLTISGGNTISIGAVNTDNQNLTFATPNLTITGGNTVNLSAINTDAQNLAFTSPTLTITGGNSVNLSAINTDNQDLSLTNDTLRLANDASPVSLSRYLDNTDTQDLGFIGTTLSLTNGGSVNLSTLRDNLGNHTATDIINLNGYFLSGDGDKEGISISEEGYVGIGPEFSAPLYPLHMVSKDETQLFIRSESDRPTIVNLQMGYSTAPEGNFIVFTNSAGTVMGFIETDPITGGVYYRESSDKRLKNNITATNLGLSDVMKMNVFDYNLLDAPNKQTGFLAQDLYQVIPSVVSIGGDDPLKKPWGIDYGKLTPILTRAIQELNQKVDKLENDNIHIREQNIELTNNNKQLQQLEKSNKELQDQNARLEADMQKIGDYEKRLQLLEKQLEQMAGNRSESEKVD